VGDTIAIDDEVVHLVDEHVPLHLKKVICQIPNQTSFHLYYHPYLIESFYSLTMPCMHKLHRGSDDSFQQIGSQRM
jgi:hypothetical protein